MAPSCLRKMLTLLILILLQSSIFTNSIDEPPNIIMVMTDDMGFGDVHYNGGIAKTPNFDEWIASEHTIVFDRGYSGAPLCSPTRASVLTGRTGDRDCIYSANQCSGIPAWECSQTMPLSQRVFTIAEAVKKYSNPNYAYQTLLIGKWHLGDFWLKKGLNPNGDDNPHSHPGMHGFDYWHSTEGNCATTTPNCGCPRFAELNNGTIDYGKCVLGHYKESFVAKPWCKTYWFGNESSPIGVSNISYIVGEDYNGDIRDRRDTHYIMSIFEEYLSQTLDLAQPIFALLWIHSPHIEYISTAQYQKGCLNGTFCDLERGLRLRNKTNFTSAELDYYGTIADIDDQMGRLRRMLSDYGLAHNTWLYYTSDNGPQSGAPGLTNGLRGRKNYMFEGGIRVPTVMEWPSVIPNGSYNISYPIYTSDFLPTVMDILNVTSDTPDWDLDGISILDILENPESDQKRPKPLAWNYVPNGYAWMDNDMKLVADNYNKDEIVYLFNISSDPYETTDLSEIYPEMKQEMLNSYEDWYAAVFKSQTRDTECLYDRASSYWQIWLPIVMVLVAVICGICIVLACLGWCGGMASVALCCACSKCCKNEKVSGNEDVTTEEKGQLVGQTDGGQRTGGIVNTDDSDDANL